MAPYALPHSNYPVSRPQSRLLRPPTGTVNRGTHTLPIFARTPHLSGQRRRSCVAAMPLPAPLPAPGEWESGLLTLPASLISDRLNVRADWEHIATRLADQAAVEAQVRKEAKRKAYFEQQQQMQKRARAGEL